MVGVLSRPPLLFSSGCVTLSVSPDGPLHNPLIPLPPEGAPTGLSGST